MCLEWTNYIIRIFISIYDELLLSNNVTIYQFAPHRVHSKFFLLLLLLLLWLLLLPSFFCDLISPSFELRLLLYLFTSVEFNRSHTDTHTRQLSIVMHDFDQTKQLQLAAHVHRWSTHKNRYCTSQLPYQSMNFTSFLIISHDRVIINRHAVIEA